MKPLDVAVIGAGIAGVSAAVQLKRFGYFPLVFEKNEVGGLIRNANWIENYPGFPHGIGGMEMAGLLSAHLDFQGVDLLRQEVSRIDYDWHKQQFLLAFDHQYCQAERLIVATGTNPKVLPQFPDISSVYPDHVFYEPSNLMPVFQKKVVIIGAGDIAFDYALQLAKSNHVTICNQSRRVKALKLLTERVTSHPHIEYQENCSLAAIELKPSNMVQLSFSALEKKWNLVVDFLLIAIGREPRKPEFSENLKKQQSELETSNKLFFVGDVQNGCCRQLAIAAGQGLQAAMRIYQDDKE
jgi:thioredoxin reductase